MGLGRNGTGFDNFVRSNTVIRHLDYLLYYSDTLAFVNSK